MIKGVLTSVDASFFIGGIDMAYDGYLVQVATSNTDSSPYTIPLTFIKADSYKIAKKIQDLDSYRDANGILHRNALSHVPYKLEFECVPMLTNTEMSAIMANIRAKFSTPEERKTYVKAYVPEDDVYIAQDMYMPDIDFQMYYADSTKIQYDATRFAFIGY